MKIFLRILVSPVIFAFMLIGSTSGVIAHCLVWVFDITYDHDAANHATLESTAFLKDLLH